MATVEAAPATLAEWDMRHIALSRECAALIKPSRGSRCEDGSTFQYLAGYKEKRAELMALREMHPMRPFGDLSQPVMSFKAQSERSKETIDAPTPKRAAKPVGKLALSLAADPVRLSTDKHCPKCKRDKPRDAEHWYLKKDKKDGFDDQCKLCRRAYNSAHARRKAQLTAEKKGLVWYGAA